MNIEIVKTKYPKSYDQLTKYVTSIIKAQGATEEILAAFPIDAAIQMTFSSNQAMRSLYDFFDGYQIHMFPMGSISWVFRIVNPGTNNDNSTNNEEYNNRSLAEDAGFTKCFEILEYKLSL